MEIPFLFCLLDVVVDLFIPSTPKESDNGAGVSSRSGCDRRLALLSCLSWCEDDIEPTKQVIMVAICRIILDYSRS